MCGFVVVGAVFPPQRKLLKALKEITGKEPWRKKAHGSCSITPSLLSTPGKHGHCKLSQLALNGFIRLNTTLMGPHSIKLA
jgi:hypothetical protein